MKQTEARRLCAGLHVKEKPPYLTELQWRRLDAHLSGDDIGVIARREGRLPTGISQSVWSAAYKVHRYRQALKRQSQIEQKIARTFARHNLPYFLGSLQRAMRGQDKSLMR